MSTQSAFCFIPVQLRSGIFEGYEFYTINPDKACFYGPFMLRETAMLDTNI